MAGMGVWKGGQCLVGVKEGIVKYWVSVLKARMDKTVPSASIFENTLLIWAIWKGQVSKSICYIIAFKYTSYFCFPLPVQAL